MNPFEMVVAIVFITAIASVARAKYGMPSRLSRSQRRTQFVGQVEPDRDAERMRNEITGLKERIAVLERVITETNSAAALDREIEKLR